MKILRAADYRHMPWKNGKGETVEIAVSPPDAPVGEFDWRISMATVANDGPFSLFEHIDRTLSVLSGDGILLTVEGQEGVRLEMTSPPHFFAADIPTSAELLGAPITDLNVMTRRGRFRHTVEAIRPPSTLLPATDIAFILCTGGNLHLSGDEDGGLQPLECAVLSPGESVVLSGSGEGFMIRILQLS